jgi:hypothetical protein
MCGESENGENVALSDLEVDGGARKRETMKHGSKEHATAKH